MSMKQQPGVVSMMSALMVSVLMIVVSMGLIVYINSSTQQGSDNELSLRAYAAAEGGVEWAYQQILAGTPPSPTNCGDLNTNQLYTLGASSTTLSFQNAITCMKVYNTSTQLTGSFSLAGPINSTQATIYNAANPVKTVRVQWLKSADYKGGTGLPAVNYNGPLPANDTNTPPAIELTIVNYTGTGPTSPTIDTTKAISVRNVVLLADNGTTYASPTWIPSGQFSKAAINCNNTGGYLCDTGNPGGSFSVCANVSGDCTAATPPVGSVTAVYARAMYLNGISSSNVSYQLQFYDATNNLLSVPSSNTTIDVTARSGPVYRRVVAQVPNGNVPAGLNYVIFSDTNICKAFQVPDPATGIVPTGCPF